MVDIPTNQQTKPTRASYQRSTVQSKTGTARQFKQMILFIMVKIYMGPVTLFSELITGEWNTNVL